MQDQTPLLVASGQYVARDEHSESFFQSPVVLATIASQRALAEAKLDKKPELVDAIAMVKLFADCFSLFASPLGGSNNPPASVAKRLGITPRHCIYGQAGGNTPQQFVNEMAQRIARGEVNVALITGAEAIAAQKLAVRQGREIDWSETIEAECEDRGNGLDLFAPWEISHGVGLPVFTYPLIENALRRKHGVSRKAHAEEISEMFSRFSKVAAMNRFAQFPVFRSKAELLSNDNGNYPIAEPYNKYHVAQDAVNQSAAVVMMSVGMAKALGVPEEQWVYLHACADAADNFLSQREDLSTSAALQFVAEQTLAMAGMQGRPIQYCDIYSCFPCAVTAAAEALGLPMHPAEHLTLMGGLPYFGGAGNNYSLHAIAEVVSRLRQDYQAYALITANGGLLSKHSMGLYSRMSSDIDWASIEIPCATNTQFATRPVVVEPKGKGIIESYTVVYRKGDVDYGICIGSLCSSGERFVAVTGAGDMHSVQQLLNTEPMGRQISVTHQQGKNIFHFARA